MEDDFTGTTGDKCRQSGVYKCVKHPDIFIPIAVGTRFPNCSAQGGHSTDWVFVRKPGTAASEGTRKLYSI